MWKDEAGLAIRSRSRSPRVRPEAFPIKASNHPEVIAWWSESKCQEVEQERLAIIRHTYVPVEYVRGLSERQVIGYLVEVATVFPLLHPDTLDTAWR
jgi:hypothetical protein